MSGWTIRPNCRAGKAHLADLYFFCFASLRSLVQPSVRRVPRQVSRFRPYHHSRNGVCGNLKPMVIVRLGNGILTRLPSQRLSCRFPIEENPSPRRSGAPTNVQTMSFMPRRPHSPAVESTPGQVCEHTLLRLADCVEGMEQVVRAYCVVIDDGVKKHKSGAGRRVTDTEQRVYRNAEGQLTDERFVDIGEALRETPAPNKLDPRCFAAARRISTSAPAANQHVGPNQRRRSGQFPRVLRACSATAAAVIYIF
jgi:hypothetical protein